MKDGDLDLTSADTHHGHRWLTLAEVYEKCDHALEGSLRRDTLSAFRFLAKRLKVDLDGTLARPGELRAIFNSCSAASLGVGSGRLANVKSLVVRAVSRFGTVSNQSSKPTLSKDWQALLDKITVREDRWALSRLAEWGTRQGISPADICSEHLLLFQDALEQNLAVRVPQSVRKRAIGAWNKCMKTVPGWPAISMRWPKEPPYMLPLQSFPEGFQEAVADWVDIATCDDPFADGARYGRPLREATIEGHVYGFRRLASALVRDGGVPIEAISGFEIFFENGNYKKALRPFSGRSETYLYGMARLLRAVLPTVSSVSEETRKDVVALVRRLTPRSGNQMGKRNRERLRQFDDRDAVRRLLGFPDAEFARGLAKKRATRRAKCVETALAASILTYTGLRITNLRTIHLERNIRRVGGEVRLSFTEKEMKNERAHELALPAPTIHLLDIFLAEHRGALPGSYGPYLFPGEQGGARSYSALRKTLKDNIRKHTGLDLSPHLYRHIIARIIAEHAPENLPTVSRMLGHGSINMTYQSYLGTDGPAASRTVARLLEATIELPEPQRNIRRGSKPIRRPGTGPKR